MAEKRSHSQMWRDIQQATEGLKREGRWHACRHEDSATVGVPDVSYGLDGRNGWIELKSVPRWPRKAPVRIRDLTVHQVRWLEKRGEAGGCCWLLLSVGRDYILMDHTGPRLLLKVGLLSEDRVPAEWSLMKGAMDPLKFFAKLKGDSHENGIADQAD